MIVSSILLLTSCNRTLEPDATFVAGDDIQLNIDGRVVMKYDPLTWQLGYNSVSKEFRVFDNSMRNWYTVSCSAVPSSAGQKLDATITWSSGSSTQSMKGKFEVAKSQGDIYWLWCGEKKTRTGVTVRILR